MSGVRLGECRYSAKQSLLEVAIHASENTLPDLIHDYAGVPYFRGKHRLLDDAVRSCLAADVDSVCGDVTAHAPKHVRRLLQGDLADCSQQDYVRHVCNLFKLEDPLSSEAWGAMRARLGPDALRAMSELGLSNLPPTDLKFKNAISFLAEAFPTDTNRGADKRMRNQHPASVLLEMCTGMVYHPHYANSALTDTKSPFAFTNIAGTLRDKYLSAKQRGELGRFFNTAFIRQDPCYEAVTENIMNYAPGGTDANVIFHPKPSWIEGLSNEENLAGLLAWVQRKMLADYAVEASIDLTDCNANEIDGIESSLGFARFMASCPDRIVAEMVKESVPFDGVPLIQRIVKDDLALGIELALKRQI